MEDSQIIELYWKRDESAIQETINQYGSYCHSIAFRITNCQEDADECVSDTWLRAWNSIPPKRPTRLATFLGKITRNLAIDRCRNREAKKRGGCEYNVAYHELENCLSGKTEPSAVIEQQELVRYIEEFLLTLPVKERRVFILRYWHFKTVSEIAWQYGYSVSKTSMMLHRTRKKLRTYLMNRGVLE